MAQGGDEVEDAPVIERAKVEVKAPEGHLRAAQSPEESLTSLPPRLVEINKDSEVGVMRDRLKQLKAPIYGTKAELWARIVKYEALAELKARERIWLEKRMEEIQKRSDGAVVPNLVREPNTQPPPQAEIDRHSVTHLPPQPDWCLACALARSRDKDRSSQPAAIEDPKMQFDFMYTRADGTQIKNKAEEQPWATELTGVDEATQTPLAISTPEKGGPSSNYLVKATSDFIRRMAYARVTARVDQEPALIDVLENRRTSY